MDGSYNLSNIGQDTTRSSSEVVDHLQRRNSTGNTPRLLRRIRSRTTSPIPTTHSRSSSPSRVFQVQNQSKSQLRQMQSPTRLVLSSSVSPAPSRRLPSRVSTPVRQVFSPTLLRTARGNVAQRRSSQRRSMSSGRVPNHTTAMVHNSPRRQRKVNGNVARPRHVADAHTNRIKRQDVQGTVNYGRSLSDGDGAGFLRSIESIPAHSGSRNAYDFANANKRHTDVKIRQIDLLDIENHGNVSEETERERDDSKSWIPTGIYAVMLITLWTAVVRLIDSVEGNGPVICGAGEEVRLWICAASFSLMQGLAEALCQRKNLLKVLFSMTCLFGYFVIAHIQPLSCRVGRNKVTELIKWQCALNFFVSAFLGIRIYRHILETMLERRKTKQRRKGKRDQEDSDDEFEGLPEGVL